jgi:anthranilate phosphoribosyltransferase
VVTSGQVRQESFDPASLGIRRSDLQELRGADAAYNAAAAGALLAGQPGAVRDAVLLNAAAALAAYTGGDEPLVDRLRSGHERAAQSLDSGAAQALLERWITVSQGLRD